MATITANPERGRTIFENIVEYPLPVKPGIHDYVFYIVPTSKGYGLGARVFFKKYYKNHITRHAESLEEIIEILHSEIQSKNIEQIREIVIVSHANIRELRIPVTKNAFASGENKAKYQIIRAGTLVNLQEAFEADDPDLKDFKEKRKEVIHKLRDTSRITIRACKFGVSRNGLFALYSFFGGRANVYAPHEYQFFLDELGIGVNSRLKTDLDFYQHLVKQGFISRKTKHSESRKIKIIKKLIEPGRGKHRFELSGYSIRNNRVVNGNKEVHDSFAEAFNQNTIPDAVKEKFMQAELSLSGEASIQIKKQDEKWVLTDNQLKIKLDNKEHTYEIEYTIRMEYEQFVDDENHQANLYVYPVLNHRKSLPVIPIQLFFNDQQNDDFKGQIFELAAYPTIPGNGTDTEAKQNYDAYEKLLDEGDFQDNDGHNIPAVFEDEGYSLTKPKIEPLPPHRKKKRWKLLDEITLVIKEKVENFPQNERRISLNTEYEDRMVEFSAYWTDNGQVADVEEKKDYEAYEKLLDEGKMRNGDRNIIRPIMGEAATKNAKIKQLSPVDEKKRWEFQCTIIYEIKETFQYIYPEGFKTALEVFQPVTREKLLNFYKSQGSDPDTPGTELMAYLDNHSLEELYDFIHFLRNPYKEEHAFYIYMAQEAMKRKAEFNTWPVLKEEDEKRKSDPIYIYPAWALLNDVERTHKKKYAYLFSNIWKEAKASSSRNKEFNDDLFEEQKLPFPPVTIGNKVMEQDSPGIDPDIMEQDINNPEGIPGPPPEYFEKEMIFEEVRHEELSCQKFKEALEVLKENRGKSWDEIEHVLKETKIDNSPVTLYEYLTADNNYNSYSLANDVLQFFSPYASRPGIAGGLGKLAISRAGSAINLGFAFMDIIMIYKDILKSISEGEEIHEAEGIITGLKQGRRMIGNIIFRHEHRGIPIADSYDIVADAPDLKIAHRKFLATSIKVPFPSWLEAREEGYEIGLDKVNKALNENLRKYERIFKQYVMEKGLEECHFKELLNSGLIDENMVKRTILEGLHNQISKIARYELLSTK